MQLFRRKERPALLPDKIELIDIAFSRLGCRSFADLGGGWGVDGGYTFHALEKHAPTAAILVDTHVPDPATARARNFSQLKVICGNFGDERVVRQVGTVDAVFLFDILLHQVAPDWDRILDLYASRTRCMLIYNQQWVGGKRTVRLLELGEDEYFRNVPHERSFGPYRDLFRKLDQIHPDHGRPWRDVHHIWQWGITDDDLVARVGAMGFRLEHSKNCGRVGTLANFENHAFVFTK